MNAARLRMAAPPFALALLLLSLLGAPMRSIAVVGAAGLVVVALQFVGGRGLRAIAGLTAGIVALPAGLIAGAPAATLAGAIWLVDGVTAGWGVNRGRSRGRAWLRRGLATGGGVVVVLLVVYPTLLAVDYLAKPRRTVDDAAFAIPHEQ